MAVQSMERVPQKPETYDSQYAAGGYEGIYYLPYRKSPYLPLFRTVLAELTRRGVSSLLEVGCGNGRFAHMVLTTTDLDYRGFDFSAVAVDMARHETGRPELIQVADGLVAESYGVPYDAIVCTEVLEHVPADRDMMAHWRPGAICVCSVPNFDSKYHVRHFLTAQDVKDRYGDLIDIDRVTFTRLPWASELSLRGRCRVLYQFMRHPRRLAQVCRNELRGTPRGWHVFSGVRR